MFSEEVKNLLVEVITSWQVLAVTVVLIIYVFIVNSVARLHHRPRHLPLPRAAKARSKSTEAPAPSEADELGLEEEIPKE